MLNRRNFMKALGTVVAAPIALLKAGQGVTEREIPKPKEAKEAERSFPVSLDGKKSYRSFEMKVPIEECLCIPGDIVLLKSKDDWHFSFPTNLTKVRITEVTKEYGFGDYSLALITAIDDESNEPPVQILDIGLSSQFSVTYVCYVEEWDGLRRFR